MRVTIENGIFRVDTEVSGTVLVENKDEEGKVVDSYGFAIGDECIATDRLVGTLVNGKISYIAKVNTDDEKTKEQLKKMYGKALAKAKRFEADAVAKLAAQKAAADAEQAEIDALFQ